MSTSRGSVAILVLMALVAAGLAGCAPAATGSGAPVTPSPASGSDAPASDEPWLRRLEASVDPADGSVSFETALDAFAVAFGPLPGVDRPVPDAPRPADGSPALRWITSHLDRLDGPQLAVVAAILAGEGGGASRTGPATAALIAPPMALITDAAADTLVEELRQDVAARMGGSVVPPIIDTFVLPDENRPMAAMVPRGMSTPNIIGPVNEVGPLQSCSLWLYGPSATLGPAELRSLVGSLVVQCFLYDTMAIEQAKKIPSWVMDGASVWGGETLAGGSTLSRDPWLGWIEQPTTSLVNRMYSAIGFYAHLASTGADPWRLLQELAVKSRVDNVFAYEVARAAAQVMETDWGPSYHRAGSELGKAWEMEGPGIPGPSTVGPIGDLLIGIGASEAIVAPRFGARAVVATLEAEVVTLDAPGIAGRIAAVDGVLTRDRPLDQLDGTVLCTMPGGCACPAGSSRADVVFEHVDPGPAWIGVTGGSEGAAVLLTGMRLDEFCHTECLVGRWMLDTASYGKYLSAMLEPSGFEVPKPTGFIILEIGPVSPSDGTGEFVAYVDGFHTTVWKRDDSVTPSLFIELGVTLEGQKRVDYSIPPDIEASYVVQDDGAITLTVAADRTTWIQDIRVNGHVMQEDPTMEALLRDANLASAPMLTTGTVRLACTPETLKLTGSVGGTAADAGITYIRIPSRP